MTFVATTGGIGGDEVRDLMVPAVEHRFGRVNRLPSTIEWLNDNGSGCIAHETRCFALDLGLEPRATPIESPQSHGPRPNADSVFRQLPLWIVHYSEVHPHRALGYRSPREFIQARAIP
jgi:putative transposase